MPWQAIDLLAKMLYGCPKLLRLHFAVAVAMAEEQFILRCPIAIQAVIRAFD